MYKIYEVEYKIYIIVKLFLGIIEYAYTINCTLEYLQDEVDM